MADLAGAGVQFAVAILVFLFLGRWLDGRLGTSPIFLLVGAFVGAAGGFYSMYQKVTAATRGSGARSGTGRPGSDRSGSDRSQERRDSDDSRPRR